MNTLPTLAVVDLGSNSFRLQICQNHNGQLQIIENIKQMVRLAAGLDSQKNLDHSSRQRALECLAQFGERLRGFEPEQVRAVATNTFRVAKNIADFLPEAERALGFPIEVIAGREEARLIYAGVVHTYPAGGNKMLVVDIGGGSTEFIIGRGLEQDLREETAVRFQERYHVSKNQAARVAKIAGLFLHSLAQRAATAEVARWSEYLRWAAMLHEIGTDIAHTAYHKHGAYILAQADMPGFSRSEQELLSTLVLGQRGDLKKMTDSIGSGDAMLWNAVLALRLAVLFCRARLPLELPESTALRCGSDGSGSLKIPQSWLAHNPLTAAALAQECEQWQRAGREFVVEGI